MLWIFVFMNSFLIGLSLTKENTKLLYLQTLFRHGDRVPIRLYPKDPNDVETCCPEGLGKLSVLGRKQQYVVGKYLRSMYKDFITSNPTEISVTSAAADRCLRSAEANIASFFAPQGKWKFDPDLDWQPIPVHYFPTNDKYLSFTRCPKAGVISLNSFQSDDVQSFFRRNKKSFNELSYILGSDVTKFLNIVIMHGTLYAEKVHNLTIPHGVDRYWDLLEYGANIVSRCFYGTPELVRLRAGPLLQLITENMEKKVRGFTPLLKLQIFSSHDSNLSAMLFALTNTHMPHPPYCATLIFELHEMEDGTNAVRILYLNSTRPEIHVGTPHVLTVRGCSEFCPLYKFSSIISPLIPNDWDAECQVEQDTGLLPMVVDTLGTITEQLLSLFS